MLIKLVSLLDQPECTVDIQVSENVLGPASSCRFQHIVFSCLLISARWEPVFFWNGVVAIVPELNCTIVKFTVSKSLSPLDYTFKAKAKREKGC